MKKLVIVKQDNYEYFFRDENANEYILNIEFLDIEQKPKTGDYIYIHDELLNPQYEGYSLNYTFGRIESKYGKQKIEVDDIDLIKIVVSNKGIMLKRLYG